MKWSYEVTFFEPKLKIIFHRDSGAQTKMKDSTDSLRQTHKFNKPKDDFFLEVCFRTQLQEPEHTEVKSKVIWSLPFKTFRWE